MLCKLVSDFYTCSKVKHIILFLMSIYFVLDSSDWSGSSEEISNLYSSQNTCGQ